MTARLDRYFQHTKTWRAEKQRLRAILLDFPLSEELKWRQPCYVFEGANVVILGGFKHTVDLGFFKGSLLDDPHGLLIPPGPHTQASRQLRFKSVEEIEEKEPIIRATRRKRDRGGTGRPEGGFQGKDRAGACGRTSGEDGGGP